MHDEQPRQAGVSIATVSRVLNGSTPVLDGREAVEQLVRLMRGEQAEALTLLPTEVIIRNSCGCT